MNTIYLVSHLQTVAALCHVLWFDNAAKAESHIAGLIAADVEQAPKALKDQLEQDIYEQMTTADRLTLADPAAPSLAVRAEQMIASMPPLVYRRSLEMVMKYPGGRANFAIVPVNQG